LPSKYGYSGRLAIKKTLNNCTWEVLYSNRLTNFDQQTGSDPKISSNIDPKTLKYRYDANIANLYDSRECSVELIPMLVHNPAILW